jgi:hypothetical protein
MLILLILSEFPYSVDPVSFELSSPDGEWQQRGVFSQQDHQGI